MHKLYQFYKGRSQNWFHPLFDEPKVIQVNAIEVTVLPVYDFRVGEVVIISYIEKAPRFPQTTIERMMNRIKFLHHTLTEVDIVEDRSPNSPLKIIPRKLYEPVTAPTYEELEEFARWYAMTSR